MSRKVKVKIDYEPQPKQRELHESPANEILFGGSAGPGKSYALRMEALIWALRIPKLQIYFFRRTYPELEKNHILPSLDCFPADVGEYKKGDKRWEFVNGSRIHFCHAQHEKDIFAYHGAEIHLLLIDELTTFTEFQIKYLLNRTRCTLDIPERYRHKIPGFIACSNPGGVGHNFVKSRWVDFAEPFELKRGPSSEAGMLRQYIPGLLEDNPILMERDPGYKFRIEAMPEPYRSAYLYGNWDIFIGQAFAFDYRHHVCKPMPVPNNAPLYMTFDWGFGKPFSVGWWWIDQDGRAYRFAEWYGCLDGSPDTGIRMTDNEIAQGIKEREEKLGIKGRTITRLCDPTCFNKKPDYKGGGQGPSTAEEFAKLGIMLTPGDPSRILKIRQFHERLKKPKDGTAPMLQVYDTCLDFIRTIPLLQQDKNNVEDVDTKLEDHIYDEASLLFMARPISMVIQTQKTEADRTIDAIEKGDPNENEFENYMINDFYADQNDLVSTIL